MAGRVQGPERREPGGTRGLLELIEEHRAAFEYDWRTRFHLAVDDIGTKEMAWGEAIRLLGLLLRDPSSWVHAALADWEYPVSREFFVLADQFDAFVTVNSAKRGTKSYPRPFADASVKRYGRGTAIPLAELRSTLDAHRAAIENEKKSA